MKVLLLFCNEHSLKWKMGLPKQDKANVTKRMNGGWGSENCDWEKNNSDFSCYLYCNNSLLLLFLGRSNWSKNWNKGADKTHILTPSRWRALGNLLPVNPTMQKLLWNLILGGWIDGPSTSGPRKMLHPRNYDKLLYFFSLRIYM